MKMLPAILALSLALPVGVFAEKSSDKKKPPVPAAPAPVAKVGGPKNVTPDEAEKLMAERKDLVVVDVRTVEEFEMAHIAGAKNISFIDLDFAEKIKAVEGKPVLVHCASGNRSLRAVMQMIASGKFPEIYHLNNGFSAWQEAGKTVVKTPKAK
jgi:rhodanese-related sulfurtransferase